MVFGIHFIFFTAVVKGGWTVEFVESGGDIRKPGDSLHLSCKTSGFKFSDYWLSWYRVSPGKGLEWVSSMEKSPTSDKYYASSVKGRFTISRDNSKNTAYLQMNKLNPEDTAMYYCRDAQCVNLDLSSDKNSRGGQGPGNRVLQVFRCRKRQKGTSFNHNINFPGDQTTSEPSVSIMKSENESIAACLAKDFYPKELKILMNSDSEIIFEATDPILTSSGKYSAVKVVKLSSNELVSCYVQHNSKLIKKTQTAEKPPDFTSPAPTIIVPEPCNISTPSLEDPNEEKNAGWGRCGTPEGTNIHPLQSLFAEAPDEAPPPPLPPTPPAMPEASVSSGASGEDPGVVGGELPSIYEEIEALGLTPVIQREDETLPAGLDLADLTPAPLSPWSIPLTAASAPASKGLLDSSTCPAAGDTPLTAAKPVEATADASRPGPELPGVYLNQVLHEGEPRPPSIPALWTFTSDPCPVDLTGSPGPSP
ncbi:uncharacterized protein LOC117885463 [Trachemys scripta elegans]|uniref:uncharacterized protein LOC117885463 n=1 Tax=Trachemys scripta elegans TaxID=31138 RepID=UPI0015566737|nr:uncharacterized protein LOC117885463 [Trachemys scripta elegans]